MSDRRAELEDVPLRERIARNPRPALLWSAGAAFLLVLELGAVANTLVGLGGTLGNGVGSLTGLLFGSTTGNLGTVAGGLVGLLLLVAVLFVVGVVITAFVPLKLTDRFGLRSAVEERGLPLGPVEWSLVTVCLLVLVAFLTLDPLTLVTGAVVAVVDLIADLPTLLSRDVIPNQGHWTPGGGWEGTFLGLSPAAAWGLRTLLIYAYTLVWLAWLWRGYTVFREHYRAADWTPRDDIVDRFRTHYWGIFGLVIVVFFLVMAMFAPALSPVPLQENQYEPYSNEFEYYDEEAGEVKTINHGQANEESLSRGNNDDAVGIMEYDTYGRFHPFGTTPAGKDMFTFIVHGARLSLFIALAAIIIGTVIAAVLALATAYYKGLADLVTVVTSDSIQALPFLLVVMMVAILFRSHPIAEIYDGGLLFALVFGFFYWPFLWRSVRGPALQISEEEWIDAAKSFGQRPSVIMRKHMAPYISSYLLIYASLSIGGVIVSIAALSFLGIGITAPTPEWGRLISNGEQYITTDSWHIATVPGVLITLIVLGFNAFGDGMRDAVDPQSDEGSESAATAGGGG